MVYEELWMKLLHVSTECGWETHGDKTESRRCGTGREMSAFRPHMQLFI